MAPASARLVLVVHAMTAALLFGCGAERKPNAELVITGVTLLSAPGAEPVAGATLVIEHRRVSAILTDRDEPPAAETVLDGRGLFATAGFWNSHVHFMSRSGATR